jgi:hypothetical protein
MQVSIAKASISYNKLIEYLQTCLPALHPEKRITAKKALAQCGIVGYDSGLFRRGDKRRMQSKLKCAGA